MRRYWLSALLLLPALGQAHSSHQDWLYGTRAYETVPFFEGDLEFNSQRLESAALSGWSHGLALEMGLTHHLMAALEGRLDEAGTFQPAASGRFRFGETGLWALDAALAAQWRRDASADTLAGGLVLAREVGDHSLALNLFAHQREDYSLAAAWRSPYFTYGFRAGLEGAWMAKSGAAGIAPQLSFEAPGDVSLTLGAWFDLGARAGDWSARLRLDYTLFQGP